MRVTTSACNYKNLAQTCTKRQHGFFDLVVRPSSSKITIALTKRSSNTAATIACRQAAKSAHWLQHCDTSMRLERGRFAVLPWKADYAVGLSTPGERHLHMRKELMPKTAKHGAGARWET